MNLLNEAVVALKLFNPKSLQKQFLVFVCFQSRWSQVRERNIKRSSFGFKTILSGKYCVFLKVLEFLRGR